MHIFCKDDAFKALSSDDITHRLVGIFLYHNLSPQYLQNGVCPSLYREHVANCLQNTLEEVYRLQVSTFYFPPHCLEFITPELHTSDSTVACQYLGMLPNTTLSLIYFSL